MVDDNLELLLKYPLISCSVRNENKHYTGILFCGDVDFNLHIVEKRKDQHVTFEIGTIFEKDIPIKLSDISATHIIELLDKIVIGLETTNHTKNWVLGYKKILEEYLEFTEFHLNIKECSISADLTTITVATEDDGGRTHFLEISADSTKTKDFFSFLNLNLPEKVCQEFPAAFSSLAELYNRFSTALEAMKQFFDVMDGVDMSCCILDPEIPTRRDVHRRIWLNNNCSVMMVLDPHNVRLRPTLKFLGPDHVVAQYLERMNEKVEDWDENKDFLQNLLTVLDLQEFPRKDKETKEMLLNSGECSICFSLRLNGKIPEIICGNKSCENFYHRECLYEWLMSINSRRVFNQLHGQCPNCEKKISCPVPNLEVVE